jgi:DNA-binding MarR family transcriptional regulator
VLPTRATLGRDPTYVNLVNMEPSELTTSYLIGRADRIVRQHLEEALAGSGLTIAEFTTLSVLRARPGLSNARLARRALVTPQAMHKVIRSLEDAGLVSRTAAAQGGRALEARITEAGASLVAMLLTQVAEIEDDIFAALDAQDRRELLRLLVLATSTAPA